MALLFFVKSVQKAKERMTHFDHVFLFTAFISGTEFEIDQDRSQ